MSEDEVHISSTGWVHNLRESPTHGDIPHSDCFPDYMNNVNELQRRKEQVINEIERDASSIAFLKVELLRINRRLSFLNRKVK